jgi:DNA-binding CsgD family transcriptional regulator
VLAVEHSEGVARYRLPEPLREFGHERLQECGEDTALRRRHRDWHEQLARRLDTGYLSPQLAEWPARLLREHANVAAAQDFCQAEPGEAEAGLRIALYVGRLYEMAGHVSEGRYRLGQALAQAREPTVWRARGLLLAGNLAVVSGDRGAASRRQYERAAVLLGAAAGLWQSMGTTLDGHRHLAGHHRDCERQARQALGEAPYQAAYHRGLGLPADDVLTYALQQPPDKPPVRAVSDEGPLTARERQVARLIAGGRSNKDIAAELVISQRTAENHVRRILTKLDFTSRAQVAAWAVASQPDAAGC